MATAERLTLNDADRKAIKMLESRARALQGAKLLLARGVCRERIEAALDEASGILAAAAENCKILPSLDRD